jgi:hypothetical protein
VLLVLLSWALGGWETAKIDLAAAQERTAFDHPDFTAQRWLVARDGAAALAASDDGREMIVVFPNGDRLVTRRGAAQRFDVTIDGDLISLKIGDIAGRRLLVRAADAAEAVGLMALLRNGA